MRKGLVALSLMTLSVGVAAGFATGTYAAFSSSTKIDQTIGVKRSIYLNVGATSWNDGSALFSAWVWGNEKSGFFADSDAFMQKYLGSNSIYRITLPTSVNHIIFVKHDSGASASWSTLKKTESPKVAFQTINLDISTEWDTYTITTLAEDYTDDGYQKWQGSTSLAHNS